MLEMLSGGGGDVLDVGCGSAVLAEDLTGLGWRYIGVDRAPAMIAEAERGQGCTAPGLAVSDAAALPFAAGTFDAVICLGVLDRVASQENVLADIAHVTRPGGRVIASFPNRRSPRALWWNGVWRPVARRMRPVLSEIGELDVPPLLRTQTEAETMMRACGVTPVAVVRYDLNPFPHPLDRLFPRLAATVVSRLEARHRDRLSWFANGFLVVGLKGVNDPGPRDTRR